MHRFDRHPGLAKQIGGITAPRAPERIVDHLNARLGDDLQVHQLGEPLEERRFYVRGFKFALWREGAKNAAASAARNSLDRGLNLARHFGQSRRAVGSGVLDAVVLRRIVRGREVDGSGGLERAHGVSDGGRGRGLGNHDGRDARRGEHARRLGDEALAEKPRIAPHQDPGSPGSGLCFLGWQHAVRRREGLYIGGNSRHRQPNIGRRKLVGHNRPPSRGAKLDRCRHRCLRVRQTREPQSSYCNTGPGSASRVAFLENELADGREARPFGRRVFAAPFSLWRGLCSKPRLLPASS